MQSREIGRVRAQNGSYNLACSDRPPKVHPPLRFMGFGGYPTTYNQTKSLYVVFSWLVVPKGSIFYSLLRSIRAILLF